MGHYSGDMVAYMKVMDGTFLTLTYVFSEQALASL